MKEKGVTVRVSIEGRKRIITVKDPGRLPKGKKKGKERESILDKDKERGKTRIEKSESTRRKDHTATQGREAEIKSRN